MRTPERKKNGRWQIRWRDAHGSIRYATFKTQKEAAAALHDREAAWRTGVTLTADIRLDQLADEWRESHLAIGLRASARMDYEAALSRIVDYFGRRPLRSITPADIERFRNRALVMIREAKTQRLNAMIKRSRDPIRQALVHGRQAEPLTDEEVSALRVKISASGERTVNKAIGTMRTLLKFAQGRGYVAINAASHVKKFKVDAHGDRPLDHAVFTPYDISQLINAADEDWRSALSVAAFGGLRLGELLGLQWSDIELPRNRLLVRQQLVEVTGELREPKTRAGTRFVELPTFVMSELKKWKLRCPNGQLDLCFPNSDGGPMDGRNFRNRVFYPALRRAKLRRIRVHDLRHTAASLMIATGADLAAISRQLGHANVSITLATYTHFFEKRGDSGLGARMEALVQKELGCDLVAQGNQGVEAQAQVIDLMVAREGIEPPTRGFSVRCSTN